ncbi:MAG: hypothetical protein ACE5JD_01485 [Candidatus Methylomirabilia bacterium]
MMRFGLVALDFDGALVNQPSASGTLTSGLGIGLGDRAHQGPLAGLVGAWAETLGDVPRILREFERWKSI